VKILSGSLIQRETNQVREEEKKKKKKKSEFNIVENEAIQIRTIINEG
jgi:hypothetical protein